MAPAIIYLFDRMGVPFSRTKEGLLDFRRFGGTKHHRTAFAGASTGQQLLYALTNRCAATRSTAVSKIRRLGNDVARARRSPGCRGLVAMNLRSLELQAFPADAGDHRDRRPGLIYGKSTNSMVCTGSAVSLAINKARNMPTENSSVHPTSIPGEDKLRLMSESALARRTRLGTPSERPTSDRHHQFLRRSAGIFSKRSTQLTAIWFRAISPPAEIFQFVLPGWERTARNQVFLDLTHIPAEVLDQKLGAILEIYEMFVGDDPRHVPMRIFPGVHYSMGGLWVDYDQRTNISGLLAAGECDYSIHGAEPARRELAGELCLWRFIAAPAAINWAKGPSVTARMAQDFTSRKRNASRKSTMA